MNLNLELLFLKTTDFENMFRDFVPGLKTLFVNPDEKTINVIEAIDNLTETFYVLPFDIINNKDYQTYQNNLFEETSSLYKRIRNIINDMLENPESYIDIIAGLYSIAYVTYMIEKSNTAVLELILDNTILYDHKDEFIKKIFEIVVKDERIKSLVISVSDFLLNVLNDKEKNISNDISRFVDSLKDCYSEYDVLCRLCNISNGDLSLNIEIEDKAKQQKSNIRLNGNNPYDLLKRYKKLIQSISDNISLNVIDYKIINQFKLVSLKELESNLETIEQIKNELKYNI